MADTIHICFVSFTIFAIGCNGEQLKKCQDNFVFVIDGSTSKTEQFDTTKRMIVNISKSLLEIGKDQVAVLEYGNAETIADWPRMDFGDIKNNKEFELFVSKLQQLNGISATADAFTVLHSMLEGRQSDVRTWILLFTDGFSFNYEEIKGTRQTLLSSENVILYGFSKGLCYQRSLLAHTIGSDERAIVGDETEIWREIQKLFNTMQNCSGQKTNNNI